MYNIRIYLKELLIWGMRCGAEAELLPLEKFLLVSPVDQTGTNPASFGICVATYL